jgi:hypothetical protein
MAAFVGVGSGQKRLRASGGGVPGRGRRGGGGVPASEDGETPHGGQVKSGTGCERGFAFLYQRACLVTSAKHAITVAVPLH